jgi:hypothetical protein
MVTSIITIYLLSLFSLILGYGSGRDYYRLQEFGIRTTAEIMDTYDVPRVGTGYTIRFYTQSANEVIVNVNGLGGNQGDQIEILYDPNDHGRVILASATPKSWIGYLASGIFFFLATIAIILHVRDKQTS